MLVTFYFNNNLNKENIRNVTPPLPPPPHHGIKKIFFMHKLKMFKFFFKWIFLI